MLSSFLMEDGNLPTQALSNPFFGKSIVFCSLKILKFSYKQSPDGIPSCLFTKYATVLLEPLAIIFNIVSEVWLFS